MKRYIGNNMTRAAAKEVNTASLGLNRQVSMRSPRRSPERRGNNAGLVNQKTARLEHSAGGYNNPENHQAYYNPKRTEVPRANIPYKSPFSNGSRDTMIDRRVNRSNGNSVSILSKLI